MQPKKLYELYVAMKSHFNSTYDFIQYRGQVKSISGYDKRQDKRFFVSLSRRLTNEEAPPFLLAHFIRDKNYWIGDMLEDNYYNEWILKMNDFQNIYTQDILSIKELADTNNCDPGFLFKSGEDHPVIFRIVQQELIELETFITLNKIIGFKTIYDEKYSDIIWETWSEKMASYAPFLNFHLSKYKQITYDIFNG